jgi:hypothetical protein
VKYILIEEDGQLCVRTAPRYDVALRDVGPEGWDQVRCHQRPDLRGFVNDCGAIMPDRYGRNIIGSLLLAVIGANVYPYCGPVLITGWDDTPGDEVEIIGLTDRQLYQLKTCHGDIRAVLDADREGRALPPLLHCTRDWQTAVLRLAGELRTAATPTPTVLTGDEALAYLRRQQ